jgi:serine/threonine-protein kinase HipA
MSVPVRALRVWLHDCEVGDLVYVGGRVEFRFHDAYWQMPDRPVLGQWFEGGGPGEVYAGPGSIPAFFDNLQPEGALRRAIARAHALGAGPLELLAVTGSDLAGAVRLVPEVPVVVRARAAVRAEPSPHPRFSLAGVQLKLSMSLDKDDRLTIPTPGELGGWIVKVPPPDRYRGLSENEAATMGWARRAGFEVAECEVVTPEAVADTIVGLHSRPLLRVRRFDREPLVHQEDLAQVFWLTPEQKQRSSAMTDHQRRATTLEFVGQYAKTLGDAPFDEFVRRLVFVIASGNGDAHLKNWAVWYPDRKNPRWAPLYDQISTIAWHDSTLALPLFGSFAFSAVHDSDLVRLADLVGYDRARTARIIDETLTALHSAWGGAPAFPPDHEARLRAHWSRTVPLLRRRAPLPR